MQQPQETLCSYRNFNNFEINTASTPKKQSRNAPNRESFKKFVTTLGNFLMPPPQKHGVSFGA